ncbi:MAG: LPXTG cell wall anchor domain-containing protein [Actinomycetota bacterium]|nr:LPXTG cell wall anchor domain-containing protein [Actinomycetota bacterium]
MNVGAFLFRFLGELPVTGLSDTLMIVGGSVLILLAAAFAYVFRGR